MTEARFWREEDIEHIDVSTMEPPGPFVTIVGWIEATEEHREVVVHLARDPIHLFPELNERNWTWEYLVNQPGEVVLKLAACDN